MDHKAELEHILTDMLRHVEPKTPAVTVSSDGEFAIYNVGSRYQLLKLSPAAKEFLRSGDPELIRDRPLFL